MELIQFSNFEKIANTFTARDIARNDNLYFFDSKEAMTDFPDAAYYYYDILASHWVTIIKENNKVLGYFSSKLPNDKVRYVETEEDFEYQNVWGDLVEPIPADLFLSSETPLLEIITMFQNKEDFFLVLKGNEITGTICFYDLDCNEVKLVLFSLILELENTLNKLIWKLEIPITKVLSRDRLEAVEKIKSNDLYAKYRNLLFHLNIRDKFKLLKDKRLFTFESKKEEDDFIKLLSTVRNKIAHSETIISNRFFEQLKGNEPKTPGKLYIPPIKVHIEKILHDPETMKNFLFRLRKLINTAKNYLEQIQ